jgi:hypothetical protein
MLIATECFKKNVLAKDNEMGLFVNIVFDKESREARMVVFPKLGSRKSGALKSLGSIGSRAFSSLSYELSDVVGSEAGGILSDTVYEASRKVDEKQYDKTQKTSGLYFLLPVSEISAAKDDKILLEKSIEEYGLYLCMRGTESDVALFNDEMFKETGRYTGISISLISIRGLGLKDVDGKKGRIVDAVFDAQEGTVSHLVVTTIGKGAKNRFVPLDLIDFMGMTVSKKLEDCPISLPS